MTPRNAHRRPAVGEAATVVQELGGSADIVPLRTDAGQPLAGQPVFMTVAEVRDGRVTRRVFLTLAPAQRIVEAARARGVEAHLYVLEARPTTELLGGPQAVAR